MTKEFWRSYWELVKGNFSWVKKHWIGYTLLVLVAYVVSAVSVFTYQSIRNDIEWKKYVKEVEAVNDDEE